TGDFSYFHNGIATNVKSGCTAKVASSACWHKAALHGLPNRYIQGVAIDPRNHRTVYVALSGYLRRWYPNAPGTGAIYVSHGVGAVPAVRAGARAAGRRRLGSRPGVAGAGPAAGRRGRVGTAPPPSLDARRPRYRLIKR